ncbi:MAG: glycoside hydrolase family 99-like domain-containing protein [Christensenellales bacterium]|jgi:lipopolysaccharide biosynthesis protein
MSKIKIVPIYFPQFHAIPENNVWWGEGFTDWANVKSGQPLYEGHHQPRVPLNNNYYDLSKKGTIAWQVELAKKYSVFGFTIYHYWFDGKQLLETPEKLFLQNKDLTIPFCLNWANESWSRRWEGKDTEILQEQLHEPSINKWEEHFRYLLDFFKDQRYIRIDNKPVFIIYRPHLIKKLDNMIAYWQKRANQSGFDGIYMIAVKAFEFPNNHLLKNFDACMYFQPFETMNSTAMLGKNTYIHRLIRMMPESLVDKIRVVNKRMKKSGRVYNYDEVCRHIIHNAADPKIPVYPSLFLEWDNTARYGKKSTVFRGCTPERFEYWLDMLCQKVLRSANKEKIIFINAWNEWAEGTYLEPDTKNGYGYLDAVYRCVQKYNA